MDLAYFGLRRRPFKTGPDAAGYYPASPHETALGKLTDAVAADEGFAVLTGGPGTGKTTIAHAFLARSPSDAVTALVTNSRLASRADLFQAILYDLSLPHEGRSEQDLRLTLADYLLTRLGDGSRTVLVFDEAHHLSADLLEELRLLGNLEAPCGKAVQFVLVGLPELLDTLKGPGLSALSQRIVSRAALEPLELREAVDYLTHHLRAAGARPESVVTDEALEVLAKGTGGVPRLLNQAATKAFDIAELAGSGRVDAEAAVEALAALGLELPEPAEPVELADRRAAHGSPRLVFAAGHSG